jgi:Transposase DDE domain
MRSDDCQMDPRPRCLGCSRRAHSLRYGHVSRLSGLPGVHLGQEGFTPTHRPAAGQHMTIRAARQRQETAAFTARYALRAGMESGLSQGTRRFDMRRSRYIGLACTCLQQLLNTTAMDLLRVVAWLWREPLDQQRRRTGHFARLASWPLSHQAAIRHAFTNRVCPDED